MAIKRPPVHDIFMPTESVSFDLDAFDNAVASHGVQLVHYRSLPCPIGALDIYDAHSHAAHDNCSNGQIYEEAGVCTAMFTGNQTVSVLEGIGFMDGSTSMVTLPRYYDGTDEEVMVQSQDRFFLKDYQGSRVTSQRFEHSQAGVDRLSFPVLQVGLLMDSHGEKYREGIDFVVQNGLLRWTGPRRPGYDPKAEKGTVCSVRYTYKPFWYVKTLVHDVRVTKDVDPVTGDEVLVRMPYAVLLQREYVHQNEEKASGIASPDARDVRGPKRGGFGSR